MPVFLAIPFSSFGNGSMREWIKEYPQENNPAGIPENIRTDYSSRAFAIASS
jgi:hypothetical protein